MEHRWNETDRGNRSTGGKNLSQCHCVHHKYQVLVSSVPLLLCLRLSTDNDIVLVVQIQGGSLILALGIAAVTVCVYGRRLYMR